MELQLKDLEEKVKAAELEAEQKQAALEAALAKHAFLSACTTCLRPRGLIESYVQVPAAAGGNPEGISGGAGPAVTISIALQ